MKKYKVIYNASQPHLTIQAHHIVLGEDGIIFMPDGNDARLAVAFFPYGELVGFYEEIDPFTPQHETQISQSEV